MRRIILNLGLALCMGVVMTSCSDQLGNADNDSIVPSAFTEGSKCLEIVYPISILLPDGAEVTVEDRAGKKEAIRTWKEGNQGATGRPELVFPIEALNGEGETITISSAEELRTLRKECKEDRDADGPRGRKAKCFDFVFPVSFVTVDGTVITGEDRAGLKAALKAYREENPDAQTRPELVFPVQVTLKDGTVEEILSREDLTALKASC